MWPDNGTAVGVVDASTYHPVKIFILQWSSEATKPKGHHNTLQEDGSSNLQFTQLQREATHIRGFAVDETLSYTNAVNSANVTSAGSDGLHNGPLKDDL